MKTLIELKQAAESKGLRFEVNKWDPTIRRWETDKVPNPDFMKIEIGIEYRPNIWAWFDGKRIIKYAVDRIRPGEEASKLSDNCLEMITNNQREFTLPHK